MNWTKAQQQAIETTGRDVLVTASAGTGKTAVLSHRAVERIAAADDPVRADTLLVLTFTDAAAEEMRSRIADVLHSRYRHTKDARLRQQLLLLDRAWISTIHAFCKRILTEFFYLTDLDPTFGIIDADEQRLLKAEVLDDTLEQAWADPQIAGGLEALFAGRRIQPGSGSFVDRIIPLAEFLDSVPDREAFYAHAADGENLTPLQKQILLDKLAECQARLDYAVTLDVQHCSGEYITGYVDSSYTPVIETCRTLLETDRFDLCADYVANIDLGRMPPFKKKLWPEEVKETIQKPISKVKDVLKGLADFALLSSEYARRLAPQTSLQTKILLALLRRYDENYTAAKRRRNVLDFADLEHHTLALLEHRVGTAHAEAQDLNVSQILKQRFEHVFVDEYQDINAVQQQILDHLSRDNNVFVVGDIKQSIYGFRQSKPAIFLSRLQAAQDIASKSAKPGRVDLQDNFRCRPEVIDFVNALFGCVMTRAVADMDYDEKAALVSGFPYPPFTSRGSIDKPVELYLLDEDTADDDENNSDTGSPTQSISASQRQAAFIARRIQQIVGAETGTPEFQIYDKKHGAMRDVEYRDIVILMRSLSHKAQDYVEMLRLSGVPVSSQSACGYFEATEIADCLCLLKVLDNPDRDIELAALLRSPVFNITDTQLAAVRLHADKKTGFYQAVVKYAGSGPDSALREILIADLEQINTWRRQLCTGSLAGLLDSILREKGLLSFYSALPNGAQRRANLLKLHDHAIQFEHFRTTEPGAALGRFVEFLEKLADQQQDWAPAEPDSSSENAVRIMSVHKSKGLEFPVVFVAELNTRFNRRDASGECLIDEDMIGLQVPDLDAGAKFPSMAHQVIAERKRRATLAEEMRILYVALTRAREKLILTAGQKASGCANLLTECAAFSAGIPDWKLAEVNCHLDWLLAAFSNQAALHTLLETGIEAPAHADLFHAELIGRGCLDQMTEAILQAKRSLKSFTDPPKSGSAEDKAAAAAFEAVLANLDWQYPYQDITRLPAKLSVSELTHRDDEFAPADLRGVFTRKPAILTDQHAVPGALVIGSAVHSVIEHLDLSQPVTHDAIETTLVELINKNLLTPSQSQQINIDAILSFFQSDLGRLAQSAGKTVLREWPFTYALNASAIGKIHIPETMILQGIIDMIIPTPDGLIIVDFKTDRIGQSELNARAELYFDQLRHYTRAAAAILNQPVTEAWLYFLTPQKAVKVPVKMVGA